MSLSLLKPLKIEDSGAYSCQTIIDSSRFTSVANIVVRKPLDKSLDAPVVPPITSDSVDISVKICWNGNQFSPDIYDPVESFEIKVVRESDSTLVARSSNLSVTLPSLQQDAFSKSLNSPEWPLAAEAPCCCWQVPPDNLRPFSTYLASYRIHARDPRFKALKSSSNFSQTRLFTTPGWTASVTRAEVVELGEFGTSATFTFTVKPVVGEFSIVLHHLNITVTLPGQPKSIVFTDKIQVNVSAPEITRTVDGLRPLTRYVVKAYVINTAGHSQSKGFEFATLPPGEFDPIRALRSEPLSQSAISVRFLKPKVENNLLLDNFQLQWEYNVAYELLRPDLTHPTCQSTIEHLCQQAEEGRPTKSDCGCVTFPSSSRFIEEHLAVEGLRSNSPYRIHVKFVMKRDQLDPQLTNHWPEQVSSPWTGLHKNKAVFTESVPVAVPPRLHNASVVVLADNETELTIRLIANIDIALRPSYFESVWAVDLRCGNWSHVVPLQKDLKSPRDNQPISVVYFSQTVSVDTNLLDRRSSEAKLFPRSPCRLIVCPLTMSRINATHKGFIGPCSKEAQLLTLPVVLAANQRSNAQFSNEKALHIALVAVIVTIVVVFATVTVIVVTYLKKRDSDSSFPYCFESSASKLRRNHNRSSSAAIQLLERSNSGPRQQKTSATGPLTGSTFCYRVASACFADFVQEFGAVCTAASLEARKEQLTNRIAELPCNMNKNRYANVLPYDHTRVALMQHNDEQGADYFNANFVYSSSQASMKFIAAQGPLPWTIEHFWQVVFERGVTKIVMLTDLVENSRESVKKCAAYWPKVVGQPSQYKNFKVTLMRQRMRPFWIERMFEVKNTDGNNGLGHLVMHFQYCDWPDHGVPTAALPLLRFTQRVLSCDGDCKAPIVVHCSAGIGRSGVFMVLANELERLATTSQLDPAACLVAMRRCRAGLVQTPEQYRFIYLALYEAVRAQEVGDHSGLGIPTESHRLQAWLRFDLEHGSKLCDWATSRVPQVTQSDGGNSIDELPSSSFYLPGPVHSRQIVIVNCLDEGPLLQRLRMWANSEGSLQGLQLVLMGPNESALREMSEQMLETFHGLSLLTLPTSPGMLITYLFSLFLL